MTNPIKEYFAEQEILITGATGLLGKALVEKLLRSCEQVKKIYVLIRDKKGTSCEDRLKSFKNSRIFDIIKSTNPNVLDKIVAVPGNLLSIGMGLSEESVKLMRNVNIIYHVAATVRFDEPLKYAILLNLRGTREALIFASELKNLKMFIHVSTAYCYPYESHINEQMYEPKADWRKTIKMAEKFDDYTLNPFCQKFIKDFPNTYTITKHLAEQVAMEFHKKIPVIIVRPTIAHGALSEPVPGWFDNYTGVMGVLAGVYTGIVRMLYCDPDITIDITPIDTTIKVMLLLPCWYTTQEDKINSDSIEIYNISSSNIRAYSIRTMVNASKIVFEKISFNKTIWYPNFGLTSCIYNFYLQLYLFHVLPAILLDGLCRLFRYDPFFMKLQRRNLSSQLALKFFIFKEYTFETRRALDMLAWCRTIEDFQLDKHINTTAHELVNMYQLSVRRYILNEDDSTLPSANKRMKILKYVDFIIKRLFIAWFLYNILEILNKMLG